jgi:hypothetical protein
MAVKGGLYNYILQRHQIYYSEINYVLDMSGRLQEDR